MELKNKYRDAVIQHATEYYKQIVDILTPKNWEVPVKSQDKVIPLGKFLTMNKPRTEYRPEFQPFVPSIVAQDALYILSSLDLRCQVLRDQLDNSFKMILLALEEMEGSLKTLEEERIFREEYITQQEEKIEHLRELIYNFNRRVLDGNPIEDSEETQPSVPLAPQALEPLPRPERKSRSRKKKGLNISELKEGVDYTAINEDDMELPEIDSDET